MHIYAINGSPRKHQNTATLLEKALEGARSVTEAGEVETTLIHSYDSDFSPCISCFECKRLGGKFYGKCALNDSFSPLLAQLSTADGLIFGSPIYFFDLSGKMRIFLERLLFPLFAYTMPPNSLAPRRMPTACVYTMNITEEYMMAANLPQRLSTIEGCIGRVFTPPEIMYATNTSQFDDYAKYQTELFSAKDKAAYREQHFPIDCEHAFQLGASVARRSLAG